MTASFHPSDHANIEAFKAFGAKTYVENLPVVSGSEIIFISVKPTVVSSVLEAVRPASAGKLFISIAMGVTLRELENV